MAGEFAGERSRGRERSEGARYGSGGVREQAARPSPWICRGRRLAAFSQRPAQEIIRPARMSPATTQQVVGDVRRLAANASASRSEVVLDVSETRRKNNV